MAAWTTAPLAPKLPAGAVHLWLAELNRPGDSRPAFWDTLSIEERNRALRFRFGDQQRFIAAHGILRDILSRYLAIGSATINFDADSYGKPFLAGDAASQDIQFNLSHSEALAVCAVTRGRRIGVDVEFIRPIPELRTIARQYFTPSERAFVEDTSGG